MCKPVQAINQHIASENVALYMSRREKPVQSRLSFKEYGFSSLNCAIRLAEMGQGIGSDRQKEPLS